MTYPIEGTTIERVAIVDDRPANREMMRDEVTDAELIPDVVQGRFKHPTDLIDIIRQRSQAAICDHVLTVGNFAPFMGAEVVSQLYREHFPALLVTDYSQEQLDEIRLYRRRIPVLLPSHQVAPDTLRAGLRLCIDELDEEYTPERRPWQTLVRIERLERAGKAPLVYVMVPGWDPHTEVRLPYALFPQSVAPYVRAGERLYAQVNIGAEKQEELFFDAFEYRQRRTR